MDRTTKRITFTKWNYAQYLPIKPIAFSVASSGAMGSPGQVIIVDEELKLYDFQLYNMEECEAAEIIPALFELGVFGNDIPWKIVPLGFGNYLVVADSIYSEFCNIAYSRCQSRGDLYQQWIGIIEEIVSR